MHLLHHERFQFCYFLNTEKCFPPIQNIECLMKSERSFVTVQRIDGVEIPPWPSPCTHKEQSQMTEHQASFQKMSFLILYCVAGLLPDTFHNCMSRFNYFMSSLIKSKLSSNTTQLCLWFALIQAFLPGFAIVFHLGFYNNCFGGLHKQCQGHTLQIQKLFSNYLLSVKDARYKNWIRGVSSVFFFISQFSCNANGNASLSEDIKTTNFNKICKNMKHITF